MRSSGPLAQVLNALHYPISYDDELERVDAGLVGGESSEDLLQTCNEINGFSGFDFLKVIADNLLWD